MKMPDPMIIDPEPERYYDWMLWKGRQLDKELQKSVPVHEKEVVDQMMYVTAEECGELVQACMKIARWGIDKKKHTSLLEEAGDVKCMLDLLVENGMFTKQELKDAAKHKRNKLKRYTPVIVKEPNG
jgi:NTP pyrophosphatase (non-canonical NTP hydrolase)